MPNWCSNNVKFEATAKQLKKLQRLFENLSKKERDEECGTAPDFIEADTGYFFCTRWEENVLYYETRWSPNTDVLVSIADCFKVDFIHEYEECGCLIFGIATYKDGLLTVVNLESEDFDLYDFDDENDNWVFEGQRFESDYEIKEILLGRKNLKV